MGGNIPGGNFMSVNFPEGVFLLLYISIWEMNDETLVLGKQLFCDTSLSFFENSAWPDRFGHFRGSKIATLNWKKAKPIH